MVEDYTWEQLQTGVENTWNALQDFSGDVLSTSKGTIKLTGQFLFD